MTEFTGGPPGRTRPARPTVLAFVGAVLSVVAVVALLQLFAVALVGLPVALGTAVGAGLLAALGVQSLARRGR